MTTLVPSVASPPSDAPAPTVRQFIRYLFYKARPSWRQLSAPDRQAARSDLLTALEPFAQRLPVRPL